MGSHGPALVPTAGMSLGVSALRIHDGDQDQGLLQVVQPLYAEVYAEPPYLEGPAEVADFAGGWARRAQQPGFRLVVAFAGDEPVGFSFGHRLRPDSAWWDGLLSPAPDEVTSEHEGRTFAVIELAVRKAYRHRRIGGLLHWALLAGRSEDRVTLLVRPEATAAIAAYRSWGYEVVGRLRPFPDAPTYVAMLRSLPLRLARVQAETPDAASQFPGSWGRRAGGS
jgi:ribosomal protein S18 acetylase RimI-like enzyme